MCVFLYIPPLLYFLIYIRRGTDGPQLNVCAHFMRLFISRAYPVFFSFHRRRLVLCTHSLSTHIYIYIHICMGRRVGNDYNDAQVQADWFCARRACSVH